MPRRCTVCAHSELAAINRALASGTPLRDVARRHGLSRSALSRHSAGHIQEVMAAAAEAQIITDIKLGADLLQHVRDLQQAGVDVLNNARRRGDDMMALAAIKTLIPIAERLAQLPPSPPNPAQPTSCPTPEQRIAQHDRAVRVAAQLRAILMAGGVNVSDPAIRHRMVDAARKAKDDSPALASPEP